MTAPVQPRQPASIFDRWEDVEVMVAAAPEQPPPGPMLEDLPIDNPGGPVI